MFILAWALVFLFLFLFFYYRENSNQQNYQIKDGMITLRPDSQGHYRMPGFINGYSVNFMVDTGASLVAIPENIASRLHLTGHYPIKLITASGEAKGSLTRVNSLSFGNFELKDIKAVIVPDMHDDTVLLGMNVLSRFQLFQQKKQLIIKN